MLFCVRREEAPGGGNGYGFWELGVGFPARAAADHVTYFVCFIRASFDVFVRPELRCSDSFEVMGINRPLLEHKGCD